jgi:heme-degrading monooxygenase HmoA
MILGMSRFKVANGLEREVKEAFLNRPHLVDHVPGFLGMETFTEEKDPTAFYLLTRWTDAVSFRSWHSSPAHHQSHRGIPKGLKLDPTFTKVVVLDRLADPRSPASLREYVDDAGELLTHALLGSDMVHFVVCAPDGTITVCNPKLASALGTSCGELIGTPLWPFLGAEDATALRARIAAGCRTPGQRVTLTFQTPSCTRHELSCWIDVHPTHVAIIGTSAPNEASEDNDALYALNNDLAVLARENARTSKELAAAKAKLQEALNELQRSYWHIKKIAEVLPMCADCGKVNSAENKWENVAEYLWENSLFLSHGCCPDCVGKMRAQLGLGEKHAG